MQSLRDTQSAFAAAILDAEWPGTVQTLFLGPPARTLARLAIYRGNYLGNCANALASAYPIVQKIVGAGFFDMIAQAYARACPSRSGDLNLYGGGMPAFLEDFAPVADLTYLPDVARMEWLAHGIYFSSESTQCDAEALARIPPERYEALRPRIAPGCALMESPWPLGRLWAIHQEGYDGKFEIDLEGNPDRVIVHRLRWRAHVASLTQGEFRFLDSALRGESLVTALEAATAADPQFDPTTALGRWINAQVIIALV